MTPIQQHIIAKFTSRKAIISLLLILTSTLLLIFQKVDQDHYVSLLEFIIGGYLLSQGAQDVAQQIKTKNQSNSQ